ncbi:hypothetical protein T492DRAFT_1148798, partial [Pavlovales sp. CCMP2436]
MAAEDSMDSSVLEACGCTAEQIHNLTAVQRHVVLLLAQRMRISPDGHLALVAALQAADAPSARRGKPPSALSYRLALLMARRRSDFARHDDFALWANRQTTLFAAGTLFLLAEAAALPASEAAHADGASVVEARWLLRRRYMAVLRALAAHESDFDEQLYHQAVRQLHDAALGVLSRLPPHAPPGTPGQPGEGLDPWKARYPLPLALAMYERLLAHCALCPTPAPTPPARQTAQIGDGEAARLSSMRVAGALVVSSVVRERGESGRPAGESGSSASPDEVLVPDIEVVMGLLAHVRAELWLVGPLPRAALLRALCSAAPQWAEASRG